MTLTLGWRGQGWDGKCEGMVTVQEVGREGIAESGWRDPGLDVS